MVLLRFSLNYQNNIMLIVHKSLNIEARVIHKKNITLNTFGREIIQYSFDLMPSFFLSLLDINVSFNHILFSPRNLPWSEIDLIPGRQG